jgi:hypothetical protein
MKRILPVNDSSITGKLIGYVLIQRDYTTGEAEDGMLDGGP